MVGEIPCDPDVISSWRFCEAEAEYITHCWSLMGVAWDFEKAKWAKYFLEMLWGLEYSICFIILMISMCFFPSEYHDDFAILTVSEILRSWPLSAHFLLLPVLGGPTIHRRWIHIYIHTYILYLLDWSLQFIPLGFGLISKLMDIISLDPRNAQLPRCRAARWRNITFLRISSCSSWCKPLRNDETRSII